MVNRIKNCLNNENGSPQIEALFGISVALSLVYVTYGLGRSLYRYLNGVPGSHATANYDIVVGYRK